MAAPFAYFDTSVVVKRYFAEAGSVAARTLLGRHRCLSSSIMPIEVVSAVGRRQALGDVAAADLAAVMRRLAADRRRWELVAVTPAILKRAEGLVRDGALRTLDAIHLAAALTFRAESGMDVPFVTADAPQRAAAERAGLALLWVG